MVLYKRKELNFIIPPTNVPADTQCWLIPETGEIFPAYESFLERLAFYNMRRFGDSISGESNLTFWEALEKEKQGSQDIDADFPEALREPILRKCQFSQKGRLSDLVASLFHEFKDNIIAGEHVQFKDAATGMKVTGLLKERTVFYDRPDLTRYFVQVPGELSHKSSIACVDRNHIWRKPRTFTKYNLQRFLRHTIHRQRYDGAPWLVKEVYARLFKLDMDIPHHMTQEALTAERRLQNGLRRNRIDELPETFMVYNNHVMPKPGARPTQHDVQYVHQRFDGVRYNGEHVLQMRPAPQHRPPGRQVPDARPPPPPAPPPIKYPIEDLQLELKKNPPKRPPLLNFEHHQLFPDSSGVEDLEGIHMSSMGPLLETWNTLTVFAEFFSLDGFVFDDFAGAMFVTSETVYCELFHEVHCAVLMKLVDESGLILANTLAKVGPAASESDDSSRDTSSSPTGDAVNGDASETDSSGDVEMKEATTNGSHIARHRASEMITIADLTQMLQNRQFSDGGWTIIMAGVFNRLSSRPRLKDRCERILAHLAPLDKPATAPTAWEQYMSMDVNLRIQALEMITILVTETKPFKEHIETLVIQSTDTRKEKTSLQSQAKPLRIELTKLEQQEKLLRPDTMNEQQENKPDHAADVDAGTPIGEPNNDTQDEDYSRDSDESEEEEMPRSSRRISNRAADLKKRKRELEDKKQTQEETKEVAEYRKVLREFDEKNAMKEDLEEQIEELEQELRENSCYRTRLMGRDRFLNRYIWFERNGMPFEGDSNSTKYKYANGRLWVQGPDPMERPGILDLNEKEEKDYQAKFKITVAQRRDREEGETQLHAASDWGYYDDPEQVEKLIDWLEVRGERERLLKKELGLWRKPLYDCMRTMKKHLQTLEEEHLKKEDRQVGIATRKKSAPEENKMRYPCCKWKNLVATKKYGQLLSEGPPAKRTKKAREAPEPSPPPERRATRQGRGGR